MKQKNQKLLVSILNIREKMTHQMYMHKEASPVFEREMGIIQEKIREVKNDIANKATKIKLRRDSAQRKNAPQATMAPLKIALVELKDATEVLSKETLKQREELALVIKHMHNQPI